MIIDFRTAVKFRFSLKAGISFSRLVLSTLVYNYIGLALYLWRRLRPGEHLKFIRRVVIIGYGGVGNHLMLVPALTQLKGKKPDIIIHVFAASAACAEVLQSHPAVDSVSVLNVSRLKGIRKILDAGRQIRLLKPDAIISASGINPVSGGVLALLSRSKIKIGENWRGRGFLYTHRIKPNYNIYEAIQNIRLVRHIVPEADTDDVSLKLHLNQKEMVGARSWHESLEISLGKKLIGIHPGSGNEQRWKRWPIDKFVHLSQQITKEIDAICIFFLGPDEKGLESELIKMNVPKRNIYIAKGTIRHTAACIGCCNIFISNDSGLRQIAVALSVKTFGIFGPTSIRKNFKRFSLHEVICRSNVMCRPCHYTRWLLACNSDCPCLKNLSVKKVKSTFFRRSLD